MAGISNHYPDFEKHKKIHVKFIEFYEAFQEELKEEGKKSDFSSVNIKKLMRKIKSHLADWWINHITTVDKKYAKYIEAHSK